MASSTSLLSGLRLLYKSYGRKRDILFSGYFWLSLLIAALSWHEVENYAWAEIAKSVLPNLTGFSIAAYAIFFAVLDDRARVALSVPLTSLEGRSPLLVLSSSVSHAVIVQITAIVSAIVIPSKPFPPIKCMGVANEILSKVFSALGLLLTIYGIILIIASILSIFRLLEIQSRVRAGPPPAKDG